MPAGATAMAAKPVAGSALTRRGTSAGRIEGVARTDREHLAVELDGRSAVQHGPHLLGVDGVQRPGLAGPHVHAPDGLSGTALVGERAWS